MAEENSDSTVVELNTHEETGAESSKFMDEQIMLAQKEDEEAAEAAAAAAARLREDQSHSADAEFRRGLEELVRDHFDSCIALASAHGTDIGSSGSSNIVRTHSFQEGTSCSLAEQGESDGGYEFSEQQRGNIEADELQEISEADDHRLENTLSRRHSRILNRWYERGAEEVITTMERQTRQAELLALAGLHAVSMLDSSFLREPRREDNVERPRPRISPLVQMWRGLEREQRSQRNRETGEGRVLENDRGEETEPVVNGEETGVARTEQESVVREAERVDEHDVPEHEQHLSEVEQGSVRRIMERGSVRQIMQRWMNERVGTNNEANWARRERNELLDLNERERVRQLARDWLQGSNQPSSEATAASVLNTENWEAERRRDRQLVLNLLMRTERERQRELEGLSEHRAVSSFPHRGRLQSFLRGRFLRTSGDQEEEVRNPSAAANELGQLRQRRAVSGLRDGFRSRLESIVHGHATTGENLNRVRNNDQQTAERNQQEVPQPSTATATEATERTTRWRSSDLQTLQDATAYNMELQELLGRRSVSNMLASEFRNRLDQLIRSFIHRQVPWPAVSGAQVDEQPAQPAAQQQQPVQQQQQQEEQQQEPLVEQTLVEQVQEITVPPLVPPPPPPPRQPLWQQEVQAQWARSSLRSPQYMLWDNVGELREDISQLQQGLGDLQRMVETCVDMQLELQRSIRQEVAGALHRMYAGRELPQGALDGSTWTPVKKGICCICCDKAIDSLLYRCGHMCTCLKCASQLQHSGSRCPMCRAPIVEVIRAFTVA